MNPATPETSVERLPPEHRAALQIAVESLGDAVFGLGGGALLAVLGLDVTVGDLDLMLPAGSDVPDIPWPSEQPSFDAGPLSSDWVRRGKVGGVSVDLVAGLRVRTPVGQIPVPPAGGGTARVAGRDLALSPPEAWLVVYRAHNPHRARLLEAYLAANR